MPLDQYSDAVLNQMGPKPVERVPIKQMRQQMASKMPSLHSSDAVHSVEDSTIPGPSSDLPVRIYRPEAPAGQHLSALMFLHGGGFIVGGLDSHDSICRAIASRTPCVVVSVEYRLAPEHPFPAAVDDSYAALQWVADHLESLGATSGKLAIGGDSAGGNLAAVSAVAARDNGGPKLVHQLLIYPVVEPPQKPDGAFLRASYDEHPAGTKALLNNDDALWMIKHYFEKPEDAMDPRFAVIRRDLKGLPPATVITCEVDPLRDEGKAYADKLKAAGVHVNHLHYEGTCHGFLHFPVPQAAQALDASAEDLRAAFSDSAAGRNGGNIFKKVLQPSLLSVILAYSALLLIVEVRKRRSQDK